MRRLDNLACAIFGALTVSVVWAAWFHYGQAVVGNALFAVAVLALRIIWVEEKP